MPISSSRPGCVQPRRVFLCKLGLAATAGALAGCEITEIAGAPPQKGATKDFDITQAPFTDLGTVGGMAVIDVAGTEVVLVRASDTEVLAYNNLCPHQSFPLNLGAWDVASRTLTCALHSAKFADNGSVLFFPPGSKSKNLPQYAVEFTAPLGKVTI
jgi:nitrite reductase/ring-hydroxylating ferredoxin subunit